MLAFAVDAERVPPVEHGPLADGGVNSRRAVGFATS